MLKDDEQRINSSTKQEINSANKNAEDSDTWAAKVAMWRETILETIGVTKTKSTQTPVNISNSEEEIKESAVETIKENQSKPEALKKKLTFRQKPKIEKVAVPNLLPRKLLPAFSFPLLLPKPKITRCHFTRFFLVPLAAAVLVYVGFYLFRFDRTMPKVAHFLPWPVAYADGRIIWWRDFAKEISSLAAIYGRLELERGVPSTVTKPPAEQFDRLALEIILRRLVIDKNLTKNHLAVSPEERQREYDLLIRGFNTQDELERYILVTKGWNWQQFQNNIFEPYLKQNVLEKYLSQNNQALEQAKTRAQDLKQRLARGEFTFAQAVAKFSDDKITAAEGGDLGWAEWGSMPQSLEAILRKLKLNETSEPVQTDFGYELFMLTQTIPAEINNTTQASSIRISHILVRAVDFEKWLQGELAKMQVVKLLPF